MHNYDKIATKLLKNQTDYVVAH